MTGTLGPKGKRKRPRMGAGTKSSCGVGVLSGDDNTQSHQDSASKTPWTPRYLSDLKSSNIYNRNAIEAPAEVFFFQIYDIMKIVYACLIYHPPVVPEGSYISNETSRF